MGALTQIYVDPAINANSGTGTIGDPYGDLQYAFNTATRDATNGNQFNIKVGTAEVLAAALTLATYGTPTVPAPVVIKGYTSAANDGGKGEINCNGVTMLAANNYVVHLVDLKIHNFGNNSGITIGGGTNASLINCEVYKGASTPSSKILVNWGSSNGRIIGNHVHDAGTGGTGIFANYATVYGNYVYNCPTGILCQAGSSVIENIIVDSPTNGVSVQNNNESCFVVHNSIYSSTAATGSGIVSTGNGWTIMNNVVEGYSGTGGCGLKTTGAAETGVVGYNAYYNCATNESLGDVSVNLGNLNALSASPFNNPGSGDFSPKAGVVGVIEAAFQGAWYGPASTTNKADRGAVQAGAGTGGAVRILPIGKVGL